MEFKGITVGTYISRKPKNKKEKMYVLLAKLRKKFKIRTLTKKKNTSYAKNAINAMFQKLAKQF